MFIGRSEELGLLEKLYAKNSLNVVLAVSYTHLDVYKRQTVSSGL